MDLIKLLNFLFSDMSNLLSGDLYFYPSGSKIGYRLVNNEYTPESYGLEVTRVYFLFS